MNKNYLISNLIAKILEFAFIIVSILNLKILVIIYVVIWKVL